MRAPHEKRPPAQDELLADYLHYVREVRNGGYKSPWWAIFPTPVPPPDYRELAASIWDRLDTETRAEATRLLGEEW